jgi:hypothetical protein
MTGPTELTRESALDALFEIGLSIATRTAREPIPNDNKGPGRSACDRGSRLSTAKEDHSNEPYRSSAG